MSACLGSRPLLVAALVCESLVERRHPAASLPSVAPAGSQRRRGSFFLSIASCSSTSGAKAAPGSVAALSTKPSSGSRISSAPSMAAAHLFGFEAMIDVVHYRPPSFCSAVPKSMSLKSIPSGG